MTDDQSELDEFGNELAEVKMDSQMEWAEVDHAVPAHRSEFYAETHPSEADADDYGLQITFRMASGATIEEWYAKPDDWSTLSSDLVLLLDYWDVAPSNLDALNSDDESFEVPMEIDRNRGEWMIDIGEITEALDDAV